MIKKRRYGDNWKKISASTEQALTAKSVIARFITPDDSTNLDNQQVITPSSPISHAASSPASYAVSSPIEPDLASRKTKEMWLDNSHTPIEKLAYIELYKITVKKQMDSCYISFAQLARRTGKSVNTMRNAISGLIAKLSIERIDGAPGSHHGYCYRVYKPAEIMRRRSKAGIQIDEISKVVLTSHDEHISLASYAASSPVSYAISYAKSQKTGDKIGEEAAQEIAQEEGAVLIDIKNQKKKIDYDHDRSITAPDGADKIKKFFEDFFGKENPQAQQASAIITEMVIAELREQANRAKTKPASPKFFVTSMAKLFGHNLNPKPALPTKPVQTVVQQPESQKQIQDEIFHKASTMWVIHPRQANETAEQWRLRVSEAIKESCLAEGLNVTAETLDKIIWQAWENR